MVGSQEETVYVEQHEGIRHYYMELQGDRNWSGKLVGLLLHITDPDNVAIKRIALTTEPDGPPEIEVAYFGFENGVNRAGRSESLLAQIFNRGGGEAAINNVALDLPEGLTLHGTPEYSDTTALQNGDSLDIHWSGRSGKSSNHIPGHPESRTKNTPSAEAALTFMPAASNESVLCSLNPTPSKLPLIFAPIISPAGMPTSNMTAFATPRPYANRCSGIMMKATRNVWTGRLNGQ